MKCRICARECPPGAKICRDCAAARKRAFAATVTQPLLAAVGAPSVSQARFAPRPVRSKAAARPATARAEATAAAAASERSGGASTGGGSIKWLVLGAAVVIAVAIILVKAMPGSQHVPAAEPAAQEAGAETAGAPAPGAGAFKAPAGGAIQSERRSAQPAGVAQSDESVPKKAPHKSAARKPPVTVELPAVMPAEPPAPPKAEAVAPPPRVAAPRAVEAPRDPWQAMNEGLARCAREDFFSRIGCEQKLRLQYCVNYWGTVPQCPIGPATDHGQ